MKPTRYRRRDDVETRLLDGAAVLVLPSRNLYFAINRVGARIWELLQEPRTLDGVTSVLSAEFEISATECHASAAEFLRQLIDKDLVRDVA